MVNAAPGFVALAPVRLSASFSCGIAGVTRRLPLRFARDRRSRLGRGFSLGLCCGFRCCTLRGRLLIFTRLAPYAGSLALSHFILVRLGPEAKLLQCFFLGVGSLADTVLKGRRFK